MTNTLPPLIVACDWIPPDYGAVGQYEMLRARAAAKDGRKITLIGLGKGGLRSEEQFGDGVLNVVRLKSTLPEKSIIIRRSLWTIGIIFNLIWVTFGTSRKQKAAEIKITGAPPFFAYAYLLVNAVTLRRRITYRMTDFYPETAFAARRASWLKPFAFVFPLLRRIAHRIEVLSEDQRQRLIESGLPENRIVLERDWSPVTFEAGLEPAAKPFSDDKVTLLYSGNLGVAHDMSTFCEAYRRHVHEGSNRVRLWLNAQGVGVAALKEYCADHQLPLRVSDPVPLDHLAAVMAAADAHLVVLGEPFWGYVFPSKIYAALASGKPVFYIGPPQSDVSRLCGDDSKHILVDSNDIDAALTGLDSLAQRK